MHIVVIGLGEAGRHILRVLDNEGHDVVAVDNDMRKIRNVEEYQDVGTLVTLADAA